VVSVVLKKYYGLVVNALLSSFKNKYMRKIALFLIYLMITVMTSAQIVTLSEQNKTPTYQEVINYFTTIAAENAYMEIFEMGPTDIGKPLHLLVIDSDQDFNPEAARAKGKSILLINNGYSPRRT
jgi:hypothetical protein